jgi:prepilin-type N-terminal cleavage/methylation domain-containing protein
MKKLSRGFTLIELLVVIGVIAILAAIVLVAVNPARNFSQARNTQRTNDIYQVLNACHQFAVTNDGNFPTGIPVGAGYAIDIGPDLGNGADLGALLAPEFIPTIPFDPESGSAETTNYVIFEEVDGRLTATASGAELGESITITR